MLNTLKLDDNKNDTDYYFELRILEDEITKDVSLMVVDFAENDEVVEIWILSGDAFAIGETSEEQKDLCRHYWERALSMLTEVQKSLVEDQQEAEDMEEEDAIQEQLDGVVCQIEDLRMKIEESRADEPMEE